MKKSRSYQCSTAMITLVPHGYQIDCVLSDGTMFTECRDYADNIDTNEGIREILHCVQRLGDKEPQS